ncbi:MAG: hypothetical protein ACXABY_21700 [Candidatus Thorarchaeota archaeon]
MGIHANEQSVKPDKADEVFRKSETFETIEIEFREIQRNRLDYSNNGGFNDE